MRSSHRRCSTKKGFLKNFAKFTGKQASGVWAAALLKSDSNTGIFLWIFRIFYRTPMDNCLCTLHKQLLFLRNWDGFTQLKLIATIVEECKIFSTEHNNRFSSSLWYTNQLASKCSFWYECDTLLASVRLLELLECKKC